jgi:phasin
MTTSYNPRAAADQARDTYRNVTGILPGLDTAIPESVRSVAEKSVAQSRDVYDRSKHALDASMATFERSFDAAGQGAIAFNRKIVDIAQRNLSSVFDLAQSLASAKTLAEVVELQAGYWQEQFRAVTAQAEEVRALSTKVTAAAAEPIKAHVTNGANELRKAR